MRAISSRKIAGFGASVFSEMTQLAIAHQAVNLAQGFPDEDGPEALKEAAIRAIRDGHNQYARSSGAPPLHETLARRYARDYGLSYLVGEEITVGAGATELLFDAITAICDVGDEVVLLEPFYDSYRAAVLLAGAVPRAVRLEPPAFALPREALRRAITERTRAIIVNNPHNPTGTTFSTEELAFVAALCVEHDLLCIADEVYEHIRYDGAHLPIATFPGMFDRTFTLSSLSKSFSMTGFRVGWCLAPKPLSAALRSVHQFVTFSAPTPFQIAAAEESLWAPGSFVSLREGLEAKRDYLANALRTLGFDVFLPRGTYFLCAGFGAFGFDGDDVAFARYLTKEIGVAVIPPSAFFESRGTRVPYVRFVFCKRQSVLEEAVRRLGSLRRVD
jgi:aspartate/methionine/tyrosine aminotransferase